EAAPEQLDLHLKAAGITDSLDWRRHQHESPPVRNGFDLFLQALEEGYEILSLLLLALFPIIEDDVVDAGIGKCRAIVEDGNSRNRDHLLHTWRRKGDLG